MKTKRAKTNVLSQKKSYMGYLMNYVTHINDSDNVPKTIFQPIIWLGGPEKMSFALRFIKCPPNLTESGVRWSILVGHNSSPGKISILRYTGQVH